MENRSQYLLELRPALELSPATGVIEKFQNETLRPILKFQNSLLLNICRHQFIKRKKRFFKLTQEAQLIYIEQQISQDIPFKNLLCGCIIGHFTKEEWTFFQEHEAELRKRINTLLIQRIQSQVSII